MKMTVRELMSVHAALNDLGNKELPVKLAYDISKKAEGCVGRS